ncbi:MAG: Ig-like domain-containing protein [Bacteroidota bacterium]
MKKFYIKKLMFLLLFFVFGFVGYAQVITVKQTNITTGWSKTLANSELVSFPTAAAAVSSFSFNIKNDGATTLLLSGSPIVNVTGANAAEFTVTQPSVSSLAAGASTNFVVTYNPTAAFVRTAQLSIANNSAVNPFIVNLKGAAYDFYGPAYPPIGTISTDSNGMFGRPGGGNLFITNVSLATKTQTYWGPRISATGDLMLKVSLDNSVYLNAESLTYAPAESNLTNGQAVWRGNTFIQNAITSSVVPVFIRATLTTKKPDNSIIPLIDPTTLGLSEQVGGLVQFTALSDYLVANYFIEASLNGSTWQPYLDFYDAYPTPAGPLPGQGIGNAYSSVGNGFYWKNLGPRLTQNAILNVNEGAIGGITSALLNATDDEDMPVSPQSLVFRFETVSPGTSPMVFVRGTLKLNGVAMTKTSTFTLADVQNGLLTYQHDGSESVYDEFQFSFKDSKQKLAVDGPNSIFSFRINIIPVNDSPIAYDQSVTTSYAVPVSLILSATDAENSSLTYTILSNPTLGTISGFNPTTGAYTYTPTSALPGNTDTFTFSVNDGNSNSNIATVTINLINLSPTSATHNFDTLEDITLSGNVIATDPEGSPLTYQLVSQGSKGIAAIASNGGFTYTPTTSAFGLDAFTFRAQDSQGSLSAEYVVFVKIVPRLDPGDVLVVDKTLIRLYDTVTNQDVIITQNQGLTDALNVCYKATIGLFVYDKGNGLIKVNAYTGAQSLVVPSSGFSSAPPIGGPSGMIFDSTGNIVLATSSGIVKVNPTTGVITPLFTGGLLSYPTGVAYLNNGDLVVSDAGMITGGSSKIVKITPAGVQSLVSTGGFLTLPLDFAIIDQNTIVVADAGSFAGGVDRVYKVTIPAGTQTLLTTGGNLAIPSGIDYRQNKVYAVNKGGTNKILSIDSTTGVQSIVTGSGIVNPWGLMVIPENITIPPTASAQSFCAGATVANLVATGTALQWYAVETGGTVLPSNTVLVSGTYYVTQTLNDIESAGTPVVVTITPNTINTTTLTACDTYTWANNGQTYTTSGTYTGTTTNCVTEQLVLTINNSTTNGNLTITANGSFTWAGPLGSGLTYTTSGVYTHTSTNAAGCPNLATLNLTVSVNTFNIGTSCGATISSLSVTIIAAVVPGASTYTFRITNMNTNSPFVVNRLVNSFALSSYPGITLGTPYQIEVSVNGGANYGAPCIVNTPSPVSTIGAQCGTTLTSMSQFVYATYVSSVTGYRFRVTNNTTNAVQVYDALSGQNRFAFSQLPAAFVSYGTTYSVQVALKNTNGTYLLYGPSCTITTPVFPTSEVVLSQCDYVATSNTQSISAVVVSGATNYRFQLVNSSLSYSFSIDRAVNNFNLSMFPGLQAGTTYTVRVAVRIGGVWGPLTGKPCNLTTPGVAPGGTRVIATSNDYVAIAYPNPFAANFMFDVQTSAQSDIQIRVYDMLGKQVENRNVEVSAINSLQVGGAYPSGVYNVVVSQGERTQTLRVIKR